MALTREELAEDLRRLGVTPGGVVLVHASLRSLGTVDGGAAAVVDALRACVGPAGTLVVPALTPDNSDTSSVHRERTRGMTEAQRRRFRAAMPAFDPAATPSTGMGQIAERLRTTPGAARSAHPQTSFAAVGPLAERLMDGHALDCHLGEDSPLAAMYAAGAQILLLGVGYDVCTAFHLAEYRYTPHPPRRSYSCVIERGWWSYEDVALDDGDFAALGAAFDGSPYVAKGTVGAAHCRLASLPHAVDFAVDWLALHRKRAEVLL